jgi:hypothetical protein
VTKINELSDQMLEAAVRAYGGPGTMRGGLAAECLRLRREVAALRSQVEGAREELSRWTRNAKGGSRS